MYDLIETGENMKKLLVLVFTLTSFASFANCEESACMLSIMRVNGQLTQEEYSSVRYSILKEKRKITCVYTYKKVNDDLNEEVMVMGSASIKNNQSCEVTSELSSIAKQF